MSAMPAPATAQPVDASPARPKRWTSPYRRDPTAPQEPIRPGPEQTALLFIELLANRFCRWPGSYCLWAENATIEERLGLTPSQVKRWLSHAEKSGRLLRFRGPAQFERWLELTGVPDYGLDPSGPPNMHCPCRVIVLTDLLPERIRPEGLYGPIGLDVDGANMRHAVAQKCAIEQAVSAPSHPIWKLEEKEKMKTFEEPNDSFSLITEEERSQAAPRKGNPTPVDPWDAISKAEQTERTQLATEENPSLARFPNMIRAHALARLEIERPELFAPAPTIETPQAPRETPPAPAPISQGKPRKGSTTTRQDAAEPKELDWSERLITDLYRLPKVVNDHNRSFMITGLAECFADCLGDKESVSHYRTRIWEVAEGHLPALCFADAIRYAKQPGVRNRGKAFSWFVKNRAAIYRTTDQRDSDLTKGPRIAHERA